MQQQMVEKIKRNPRYQELVKKRSRYAWTLSILMLIIYYAFILVIAFDPGLLAKPMGEHTVITIGIPIGILIIVVAFLLTGLYVWRANREFDAMTREIKEAAK